MAQITNKRFTLLNNSGTAVLRLGYNATNYTDITPDASGVLTFSKGVVLGGNPRVSNGVLLVGTTVTDGAASGDVVMASTQSLRSVNAAGTSSVSIITLDSNDDVSVGGFGRLVGVGYFGNASFPAGGASRNGKVAIDSTNNRLVFYSGGSRYYVTGTAF